MQKVLVIDDDADFVYAVRIVLEAHDFVVEEAFTPKEGIQKVIDTNPDLVILDVMMPTGYEGFDVAREIREKHKLIDLPIFILTSIHHTKKIPYRFAPDQEFLPVDVFMDKPVKPQQLVDTVKGILGKRREEPKHPL